MTTIANNTANINVVPVRIESDHYQISSFTDLSKVYDQLYDYDMKRWVCNCLDTEKRHNPNCKHVILLRTYIKREKSQQVPEQQHSSSVELLSVLSRISSLEEETASLSDALYKQNDLIDIKDQQIIILQDRLRAAEYAIKQQAETIEINRANHYAVIKEIDQEVRQHAETIKRQQEYLEMFCNRVPELATIAEHSMKFTKESNEVLHHRVNMLTEQISSQQKASEQTLRIVVEQPAPAPRQARQERQAESMEVTRVSKTECKVGKLTVPVIGSCAAGCSCSTGAKGQQCKHMIEVDKFLSK